VHPERVSRHAALTETLCIAKLLTVNDLLLCNSRIDTMDEHDSVADAVLVRDGRVGPVPHENGAAE
jgi:hypothetical protein